MATLNILTDGVTLQDANYRTHTVRNGETWCPACKATTAHWVTSDESLGKWAVPSGHKCRECGDATGLLA